MSSHGHTCAVCIVVWVHNLPVDLNVENCSISYCIIVQLKLNLFVLYICQVIISRAISYIREVSSGVAKGGPGQACALIMYTCLTHINCLSKSLVCPVTDKEDRCTLIIKSKTLLIQSAIQLCPPN